MKNTITGDEMASTQTIGAVGDFQPENETISAYLERVSLFFDVNNVAEDKQVPWLLNIMGAEDMVVTSSELPRRYATRHRRAPDRLIEQTDI